MVLGTLAALLEIEEERPGSSGGAEAAALGRPAPSS